MDTKSATHFRNGTFNDLAGNAWKIARERDSKYVYYKGPFIDGESVYEERCNVIEYTDLKYYIQEKRLEVRLIGTIFRTRMSWANWKI